MEPIPLRIITSLLNYERMISDPRFKNKRLFKSTTADPPMLARCQSHKSPETQRIFGNIPESVVKWNVHLFAHFDEEDQDIDVPSTICELHPTAADQTLHALTFAQRELIYHETRGHSGCYQAIGMYQLFFSLLPSGQRLSLQIAGEVPVLIEPSSRIVMKYHVYRPKEFIMSSSEGTGSLYTPGDHNDHCVLAFPRLNTQHSDAYYVVDMARMQYGEAGRGDYGENYFLGTMERWQHSMKNICGDLLEQDRFTSLEYGANFERLTACAEKVWARWNNRKAEGWCEYCGKPDVKRSMACCGRCKSVRYCCKEHQTAAWKLHKHTCVQKKVINLKPAILPVSD